MRSEIRPGRWKSGMVLLGLAIAMLIAGTTVFNERLSPWAFVIYWTICFLLTGLAAVSGLLEMLIIRWRLREEQRDLIRDTLEQVQRQQQDAAEKGESEQK